MKSSPAKLSLEQWDAYYPDLVGQGLRESPYGGPLGRHVTDGDYRLCSLEFDNSPAALQLWNFLLTEEERLHQAKAEGRFIVGTMKDLGTIPVMVYSAPDAVAFYPDGAWWIPCVMTLSAGLLDVADSMGIDESFCPVRAMLGAFETKQHWPIPDLLTCSVGAICDDFSAIAQRLEHEGNPVFWWEMPHRRNPDPGEEAVRLPGEVTAPRVQVDLLQGELERVRKAISHLTGHPLDDQALTAGIRAANQVRNLLARLRHEVFAADPCPLPALELLIAEMLAIHFCSDRDETIRVLEELLVTVRNRVDEGSGVLETEGVRVFWVNPVADLRVMNLLESCGGRLCGTDFLFTHALDPIVRAPSPIEALARSALADPMVGSIADRARRICRDAAAWGAEALVISRIPGASHCAFEGGLIRDMVRKQLDIPTVEIEVPPLTDALAPALRTRLEALMETVKEKRSK